MALHALRSNVLPLSLNTWYKYVNRLGLSRKVPSDRRKKNHVGIRAERPHQVWHADITAFVTSDQVRHYIYLVADNFSRKIVAWKVATVVSAILRKKTITEALQNIHRQPDQTVLLLTDGGPENRLSKFIEQEQLPLQQATALVDVHYSNSLIEAHNKLIKYNYLYRMEISNGTQLEKAMKHIVEDFNNRPHISLKGLSPNEAEQNLSVNHEQLSLNKETAAQDRKAYNQTHRCKQCIG